MAVSDNPVLHWFGSLKLAYKYIIVFLAILVLTIIVGFIKLAFSRRQLKKAKKAEAQRVVNDDTVELNLREKDEGDLFGIRAIEAGYFAGVAQSRPTSRAGSVTDKSGCDSPQPFLNAHSATTSVHSLNTGATSESGSVRSMRLQPSEAELNGRRNHNGAVDMSLHVPPSPGHPRSPTFPTFGRPASPGDENRSPSPRSADFNPEHYTPAPKIAMPDSLQVSYHAGNEIKSQQASFNTSPSTSPTPPSPGGPPASRLPTLPPHAMRKGSRSPSPEGYAPQVRVYQPNEPYPQSSATQVQCQPNAPSHKREESDSSIYSNVHRLSTFQAYQAYQQHADRADSPDSWDESGRDSAILNVGKESGRISSYLIPAPNLGGNDSRLSDFYDAYYRNSHLGLSQSPGANLAFDRPSTIMEVDSPIPSPLFPRSHQPGAAF